MESNIPMPGIGAGFDIPTLIDISKKDLWVSTEKIGSGSLNDVYRGALQEDRRGELIAVPSQICSCRVYMCVVKKIVRDSSILPASYAVKQIQAAKAILQVCANLVQWWTGS